MGAWQWFLDSCLANPNLVIAATRVAPTICDCCILQTIAKQWCVCSCISQPFCNYRLAIPNFVIAVPRVAPLFVTHIVGTWKPNNVVVWLRVWRLFCTHCLTNLNVSIAATFVAHAICNCSLGQTKAKQYWNQIKYTVPTNACRHAIQLNWTDLNWIQLHWIELNWTELTWTDLNWSELTWILQYQNTKNTSIPNDTCAWTANSLWVSTAARNTTAGPRQWNVYSGLLSK